MHACYQLLKKDGYIVAFNHNANSISAKLLGEKSPIIDIEHPYLYDKQTIRMLFSKNKFHDFKIYSPSNVLSIKHLLWLLPLPRVIKTKFVNNKNKLFGKVNFRGVYYIKGNTKDSEQECKRYTELMEHYPTDIVILGIGENTHLAFNDPHVANFNDPKVVKVASLDEKNRHQQVDPEDDICFNTIEEVPTHAITLTIPTLFKSKYAYAIVPGKNKADAIYCTLNKQIQEKYPSTILRKHPHAILYIDKDSGAKL